MSDPTPSERADLLAARAVARQATKKALAQLLGSSTWAVPVIDVLGLLARQQEVVQGFEALAAELPDDSRVGLVPVLAEAIAIRDALTTYAGSDEGDRAAAQGDLRGYAVEARFVAGHLDSRLAEVRESALREGMVLATERVSQAVSHMARIGRSPQQISDRLADMSVDVAAYARGPVRTDWKPSPEQIEMARQAVEEGLKVDPRWWPYIGAEPTT